MRNSTKEIILLMIIMLAIAAILTVTGFGFITITDHIIVDVLAVPVLIGSMIGISNNRSYIPALIMSIAWALLSFGPLGVTILYGIVIKVSVGLAVSASYKTLIELFPGSPRNVYIASTIAIVAHTMLHVAFGGWAISLAILLHLMAELGFTLVSLAVWIDKLRELHLLNGIVLPESKPDYLGYVYGAINSVFNINITRPTKPIKEEIQCQHSKS
jgi:riboflavin transporter FmnP